MYEVSNYVGRILHIFCWSKLTNFIFKSIIYFVQLMIIYLRMYRVIEVQKIIHLKSHQQRDHLVLLNISFRIALLLEFMLSLFNIVVVNPFVVTSHHHAHQKKVLSRSISRTSMWRHKFLFVRTSETYMSSIEIDIKLYKSVIWYIKFISGLSRCSSVFINKFFYLFCLHRVPLAFQNVVRLLHLMCLT